MVGITLKVGGPRTAVTVEEAQQIKARFETEMGRDGAVVKKVDLSCRQWNPEAITVLKPILEKIAPTIISLDIADTIAGLETSLGFEVMELFTDCFQGAKELVEISMDDNATGPRVLKRIAPLLGNPKLKKLSFNNCGLSAETIPQLDEALMMDGRGVARLQSLAFDRNMVGLEGAKCLGELLATCENLAEFSFSGCRPKTNGSKFIVQGIRKMVENCSSDKGSPLTHLKLQDFSLKGTDDDEYPNLLDMEKALEHMPNLIHLDLNDAGELQEVGTGIIAQALISSKCKLEYLDLGACGLGQEGAETLAELLREKIGTLKELKLETNEMENDGVEKIVAAFKGDNVLTNLTLDENELDDGAIDILMGANFPHLRVLSLKENMDLEEADDEKKDELRSKFSGAAVLISDDDEAPKAEVEEEADADVDALAEALAGL